MAYELTFLQIVNRVLSRLRESSVATYNSTDYSTMIGNMVNQVKAEIEEAYPWQNLRDTYSVTLVNGTTSYALTNAGGNAKIVSMWNTSQGYEIYLGTNREFDRHFFGVTTVQTGAPRKYVPNGRDDNGDLKFDVWPKPTVADTVKVNVYVPQEDLAADGTVPLCPQNVLIEETISRMLAEKGDESVTPLPPGQTFYRYDLLASAVSAEAAKDGEEMNWETE